MPDGGRVLIVAVSARSLVASARRAGYAPLAADLFCDDDTQELAERCARIGATPSPGVRSGSLLPLAGEGVTRSVTDEGAGHGAATLTAGGIVPAPPSSALHPQGTFSREREKRAAPGTTNHRRTLDPAAVMNALDELAADEPVLGVAYGTGLEADPDLVDAIACRWPLLGNRGATVARLKDPILFAQICLDAGIPHPETTPVPPPHRGGWLAKRRGASGGCHVVPAEHATPAHGIYFQRQVAGRAVSALFLADGGRAGILGFSEQWTAPSPTAPFRYAGAVQPADINAANRGALTSAVERIAAATGLIGLCSADFIFDRNLVWCLEVNPRPGATLDIFEPDAGSLFALHVRACRGELPSVPPSCQGARAAQIVYAEREIPAVPSVDWPKWTADRQPAGSMVAEGEPFCTVLSEAPTKDEALRRIRVRAATIMAAASGRAA